MRRGAFTGVKVFSTTMVRQREQLGEVITQWFAANRLLELVDIVVTQSSDDRFHCVSIVIFYRAP